MVYAVDKGSRTCSSQRAIIASYCKLHFHGSHEIFFKQQIPLNACISFNRVCFVVS